MRWTELSPAERRAVRWPSPAALATDLSRGAWVPARHLEFISNKVRAALARGGARIILCIPPRHGKSELCSVRVPVWLMSLRPTSRIGVITYGHQFSAKWGRAIRTQIRDHEADLGLTLNPEKTGANEFEMIQGGTVLCTGIDGTLTGHGFDLMLFDDPYKSRKEAESPTIRQNVQTFWTDTCRNRVEPGGSVILIMQRWREDDLVGYLLSEDDPEEWELINLPALAEDDDPLGREVDEPLWPERYSTPEWEAAHEVDHAITGGKWDNLRVFQRNSYSWSSQFQQRPAPVGGSIFRSEYFRYFRDDGDHYVLLRADMEPKRIRKDTCQVFQTCDTAIKAKTTSDWTVCLTYAVTPDNDLLVLDVARARIEVPDQMAFLYQQRARWSPVWQGVEDKASGSGLIQEAQRRGRPFKVLKADADKVIRATPAAVMYENGMIYHRANAPWLATFEGELLAFDKGEHDDQVDTMAYAAREISEPAPMIRYL